MAKSSPKKARSFEARQAARAKGGENLPGRAPAAINGKLILLQAALIVGAGFWVFSPALQGDWLRDDSVYLTQNPLLRDVSGLWKIWFEPGSFVEYYPLEESVQWVQWRFWHNATFGYHLTNVLLHLVSALLVWRLLSKFGLRLAWMGGLLFAIHPMQVESVAWISELKNTLSLPPFLLAMGAWLDYDARGKPRDYFLALSLFLLAMLCKIAMAPFPVVILLHAWWKRGRLGWSDVKASAPFFVLSLLLGSITLFAGARYSQFHLEHEAVVLGGFFSRMALIGLTLSFYFAKCLWPAEPLPIYPMWKIDPPTMLQFLPWPVLGGMICWLWRKRRDWGQHAFLGLGFFLINLAPFLGFITVSYMRFTWVTDHLLYLPILGLIGLFVALLGHMGDQLSVPCRSCGIGALALVMALLAWESHAYAGMFVNEETLWTYALRHDPGSWLDHENLGYALAQKGRTSEAIEEYETALQINPADAHVRTNLGGALLDAGRLPEALEQFKTALRINPDSAPEHYNLGIVLQRTGDGPEAIKEFERALQINPNGAETHDKLGNILEHAGRLPEAGEHYQAALRINPNDAEAHRGWGDVLLQGGHFAEAIDHYQAVLPITPNDALVQDNMGMALAAMGRAPESTAHYQAALRINPNDAEAHYNLGNATFKEGRVSEAIEHYEAALQTNPNYAAAHNNLGVALQITGRIPEAIGQFEEALRINPAYADARNNLAKLQQLQKITPAGP